MQIYSLVPPRLAESSVSTFHVHYRTRAARPAATTRIGAAVWRTPAFPDAVELDPDPVEEALAIPAVEVEAAPPPEVEEVEPEVAVVVEVSVGVAVDPPVPELVAVAVVPLAVPEPAAAPKRVLELTRVVNVELPLVTTELIPTVEMGVAPDSEE